MQTPDLVYVIYSADVISCSQRFIEDMSPAVHMVAGVSDPDRRLKLATIAAKFTQTEGDEQYDYGYLGKESGNTDYFPYGAVDAEGTYPDDDAPEDTPTGEGQHRKWVAELTIDEWRAFADMYLIDLEPGDGEYPDETAWMPERYEETMGSITEYGHLEAIAIDNSEGWEDNYGDVIDSQFYVSFGYESEPASES